MSSGRFQPKANRRLQVAFGIGRDSQKLRSVADLQVCASRKSQSVPVQIVQPPELAAGRYTNPLPRGRAIYVGLLQGGHAHLDEVVRMLVEVTRAM